MTDPDKRPDTPAFDATRIASGPGVPADPSPQEVITRLGAYRVLKRLGGGGMGQIFLAVQETLQRQVAIKVLPQGALQHPEMIERFRREVKVLGQLSHANICPVVEAGVENGTHYYVMEYLRGMDLSRVMKTQRIDPRRAAEIASQVLRALHSAHMLGVIHRDVKPLNVMLQRGARARSGKSTVGATQAPGQTPAPGETQADQKMPSPEWHDHAVLIDFGLARDSGSASHGGGVSDLTVSGAVIGTPSYMAPEQARGDRKAISPRTDIYALGATLYEMLCLRPPFEGETVGQVLDLVRNAEPMPPRKINALVDRDLETIVLKSLEKDPERRYATAGEMADDLDRWLAGETIRARPASFIYRTRKLLARNPLASASILVAVLLMIAGGWLAFAPGEIQVPGRFRDATITVDGKRVSGDRISIWPPRTVKAVVAVPGYYDWTSDDIEVGARAVITLEPKLVSRFGTLRVDTVPPGAEVWNGDDRLGLSPVEAQVPVGVSKVRIRLADHEEEILDRAVSPGEKVTVQRALRHETGFLTLTSYPPETSVELHNLASGENIHASTPSSRFVLPSGRYRLVSGARNCFPAEASIEIRAGGETKRNMTLSRMEAWSQTSDPGVWWTAADLNGDRSFDIMTITSGKIRALDGRKGELLWEEPSPRHGPNDPWCQAGIADLDGDLRPDPFYSAPGRGYVVLDPATGKVRREIPVPHLYIGLDYGDLDGDGLADLACWNREAVVATRGTDGSTLWTFPLPHDSRLWEANFTGAAHRDLLVMTLNGLLYGLDGKTGKQLWTRNTGVFQLPQVVDLDADGVDEVVAIDTRGHVAFSGRDGHQLWVIEHPLDRDGAYSVAGDVDGDGTVELVLGRGPRTTLNEGTTGRVLRTLDVGSINRGAPVLADVNRDGWLDLLSADSAVFTAIDLRTGATLLGFESDGPIAQSPLLADFNGDGRQDVAVVSIFGRISMLSVVPPDVLWRQGNPYIHTERVEALPDGTTLVPGIPHKLIRSSDGLLLRSFVEPQQVYSKSGRNADGTASVVLDGDGPLMLDLAAGTVRWRKERGRAFTGPLLLDCNGDGILDVISGDDKRSMLEAFDGRDGTVLWSAPSNIQRQRASFLGATPGILWVPDLLAIHALDPSTGKSLFDIPLETPATSISGVGDDIVAACRSGRIFRARPRKDRSGADIAWSYEMKVSLFMHSPSVSERSVVGAAPGGTVVSLDTSTGALRWRVVTDVRVFGASPQQDLDGDGFPEIPLPGWDGDLAVLDGATGRVIWRSLFSGGFGWNDPTWADLDSDGRPELLVTCRDGAAYAISIQSRSTPVVTWSRQGIRSAAAAVPGSRDEASRIRILMANLGADWREVLDAARASNNGWAAFQGALAARELGDTAEFMKMEELARKRGCRRLDLALLKASQLPEDQRVESISGALLAAPLLELRHSKPPDELKQAWSAAGLASLPRCAGQWERETDLAAIAGDYERARSISSQALAAGADTGKVAIALACAAFHLENWAEVRAQLKVAALYVSTADEARVESKRLSDFAEGQIRAASAALRAGELDRACDMADLGFSLVTPIPQTLETMALTLACAPGARPEHGLRAIPWAKRAVEIFRETTLDMELIADALNTLAASCFLAGEVEAAIQFQTEAAETTRTAATKDQLLETLKKYTGALKPK